MKKKIFLILIFFGIFFSLIEEVKAATPIGTCYNFTQAGEYYLNGDILDNGLKYCMNISANNVILDCQGKRIDGLYSPGNTTVTYGIYVFRIPSDKTNITIKNCVVTEWYYGVYFRNSTHNQITNITTNSNNWAIVLYNSSNNQITNITTNSNSYGIYLIQYCNNNQITNTTAISNNYGTLIVTSSDNNTIKDSKIGNSSLWGLWISSSGSIPNKIYNNLFNNTNNTYFAGTIYNNSWNTTKKSGVRVYTIGPYIGGNYWTNSTGNGYSDICNDTNNDGFCDSLYAVNYTQTPPTNNTDYLPLSDKYLPGYCNQGINTSDITYTISQSNTYYCLRRSKTVTGKNAVNFSSGIQNSTLDCLTYNLDGNNVANTKGVYLTGSNTKNNTVKNCYLTDFYTGIYLDASSNNNILVNNTANNNNDGILLFNSNNNTVANDTASSNSIGIHLDSSSYNNISGGLISGNTNGEYNLSSAGTTNNFVNMYFTDAGKIYFSDTTSWFNYQNDTSSNVWLKTNVNTVSTLSRKLINWNQQLIRWKDSASSVTARYNLTGLKPNNLYVVFNDLQPTYFLQTDSNGVLPNFTIYLESEHEIKTENEYLIIDSTELRPVEDIAFFPPNTVRPQENSAIWMNVTVNITNSTTIDKCVIRVFGPLENYSYPTFGPLTGEIRIFDTKTQCISNWTMEYWRTPGSCDTNCLPPWNVSVNLNLTSGVTNFTSLGFNYTPLPSANISVDTINFTGLAGQNVTSDNAYPLYIYNRGNVYVNISLNGSDFQGENDNTLFIEVDNVSYNQSMSGIYEKLTHIFKLSNSFLAPTETGNLYFMAHIPVNIKAQLYTNIIRFNSSSKNTEVCRICQKFIGGCQDQTTSLGANLYGCEGSNMRCYNGDCTAGIPRQPDNSWYNETSDDKQYIPTQRKGPGMTYDSDAKLTIIFGGIKLGTSPYIYMNDTWLFNFTDLKWYNVSHPNYKTPNLPSQRGHTPGMVYDPVNHRTILFGGYDGINRLNDTWEFNLTEPNPRWYLRIPVTDPNNPPQRGYHGMVYISSINRMLIHGGAKFSNTLLSDTWIYNYTDGPGGRWYDVTRSSPYYPTPAREELCMAYDPIANKVVMFGGASGTGSTLMGETWILNVSDNFRWYNLTSANPPNAPTKRKDCRMVYDSESNRTILFGGTDNTNFFAETWVFNFTDEKWYMESPSISPPGRYLHQMAYDSDNDRTILFGGQFTNTGLIMNDTWIYNYTQGG